VQPRFIEDEGVILTKVPATQSDHGVQVVALLPRLKVIPVHSSHFSGVVASPAVFLVPGPQVPMGVHFSSPALDCCPVGHGSQTRSFAELGPGAFVCSPAAHVRHGLHSSPFLKKPAGQALHSRFFTALPGVTSSPGWQTVQGVHVAALVAVL
jgi:hypothetical protein